MTATLLHRWRDTCAALGLVGGEPEYRRLLSAWSAWGRHYHSAEHLVACLREFDNARHLASHPAEVEMALWFHDAVYRTYRSNNEDRSAAWAVAFLREHGAASGIVSRISDFILATKHDGRDLAGDAALVVDIDLSILGQPPGTYADFERAVRREYWWVPRGRYAAARERVLNSLLARPAIYFWPQFRERYEAAARINIAQAIAALGAR